MKNKGFFSAKLLNSVLATILLLSAPSIVLAKSKAPASQVQSVTKVAKEVKKKEEPKGFSLSTSLSTKTDLADERKTRKFNNSLSISSGYEMENLSFSGSISYRFVSLNNDIVDDQYSIDGLSDTSLSVGIMKIGSVSASLPTSSESQYEGIKGTLGIGAGYTHELPIDSVSLSHSIGGEYVFNTYLYSPISNKATREASLSYGLSASVDLFSASSLSFGFGVQTVKLNDGSVDIGSSVNSSLGFGYTYKYENLSAGVSYSAGDFFDDKLENNWFMNQYQQVVSLRLGYKWF